MKSVVTAIPDLTILSTEESAGNVTAMVTQQPVILLHSSVEHVSITLLVIIVKNVQ